MSIISNKGLFSFADSGFLNLNQNKFEGGQSGRSMIEMLGVLAIIGVLSVGGIAGYSKAMMKFKINKTVDQISHIVGNVRTLFASQKQYNGLDCWNDCEASSDTGKLIKKAHLVPDEMWSSSGNLENPFGGAIRLYSGYKGGSNGSNRAFTIEYRGLPEEACMELATYDWGSGSSSGLIAISANGTSAFINGGESAYVVGCTGDASNGIACPKGSAVSIPMPVNIAAENCICADDSCIFGAKFY